VSLILQKKLLPSVIVLKNKRDRYGPEPKSIHVDCALQYYTTLDKCDLLYNGYEK
jgi:hypothetical protein